MRQQRPMLRGLLLAATALTIAACSPETAPETETAAVETEVSSPAADPAWPSAAISDPTTLGFSAEGLAALDARMAQSVADQDVAGMVTLLAKNGEVAQFNAYGQATDSTPMTKDTVFRIYSMSKPITGVAMMQLHEQGLWELDDPVTKHVPEFANLKMMTGVDADGNATVGNPSRAPTMREIMSHTAGFAYGLSGEDPVNTAFRDQAVLGSADLDELMTKVSNIPLLHEPGSLWYYSISVDIQGAIVERLSGQKLGAYMDEHIFTPLGMDDTAFTLPEADRSRLATVYQMNGDGEFEVLPDVYNFFVNDHAESGGGGLASTAHDYTRFVQMLINEGELDGAQILKPETARFMMSNQIGDTPGVFTGGGFGYGGAVATREPSERSPAPIGSYSWFGIDGTWFWVDPVNDLGYVGMIQRRGNAGRDAVNLRGESVQLVYEALND